MNKVNNSSIKMLKGELAVVLIFPKDLFNSIDLKEQDNLNVSIQGYEIIIKKEELKKEHPISVGLDGCDKCSGSYFYTANSIGKCDCHKDKNRVRIISDNERVPRPVAFAEKYREHIQNGGDPDVF